MDKRDGLGIEPARSHALGHDHGLDLGLKAARQEIINLQDLVTTLFDFEGLQSDFGATADTGV